VGLLKGNHKASITVFLSLTLLLLLSLIMTVIEGARLTAARVIAERSFLTSLDSVLAEFYGPLMDEYHILGLDASYGKSEIDTSSINEKIKNYMSYTINPELDFKKKPNFKLYGITLKTAEVKNVAKLTDYRGSLFIHEVTEYMKYKTAENAAETFLKQTSWFEQPQKISILYEEKVKLDEELVSIDEGILALMKYLDGISTGKKGLLRNKGGILKTEKFFAKKILFDIPTMENTGINNKQIFLALQNNYVNPSPIFESILSNFEKLQLVLRNIEEARAEENNIQEQIEQARLNLSGLESNMSSLDKDDIEKKESLSAQINEIKARISDLEDKIREIEINISEYTDEKNKCMNTIAGNGSETKSLIAGCFYATEQAIYELEQIIKSVKEAKPKIISYEENLKNYKNEIDKEVYDSLEKELNDIKTYLPENRQGYDFDRMKAILISNCEILKECETFLNEGSNALSAMNFDLAKAKYKEAYIKILGYKTDGLNIDYSTLVIQGEDNPDFLKAISDLFEQGITGLVVDKDFISSKKLGSGNMPSDLIYFSKDKQEFSFKEFFRKIKIGNKNTGLDQLFGSFDNLSLTDFKKNSLDLVAKRILLLEYIKEHFYKFTLNEDEKNEKKPSALDYEREYLIYGKNADKDNLDAIIMRLILIRTVLNFISILADKGKVSEAKVIAASLVGFTGLPVLVAITQSVLIILLAFAESLVDICALLLGYKVPFIKKKIDLNYSDLILLTKEKIKKKAQVYKNVKGISYSEYISFFLCITDQTKLSYRMMDLIQENINMRYGVNFIFHNCIFGLEAEALYDIKPLFTVFGFVKEHLGSDFERNYAVSSGYSY